MIKFGSDEDFRAEHHPSDRPLSYIQREYNFNDHDSMAHGKPAEKIDIPTRYLFGARTC